MKHESIADKVFLQLESDILSGKYAVGEILTETKLSTEFNVSRTPVREALRRLEQENLITESGKGVVILGVSKKDLSDIYDIRMRIEGLAARWAAENITNEQLEELSGVVDLQEFYTQKEKTNEIKNTDTSFHDIIYKCCNSDTLNDLLRMLHRKIQRFRKRSIEDNGRAMLAVNEHKLIYEALANHDGDEAERLTIEHIKNAKEHLLDIIDAK